MSGIKLPSPCCPAAMSIRKYFPAWSPDARVPRLSPRSRDKAANLSAAVGIAIGPNDRRAKTVGLRYQRRLRDHDPLSLEPDAITSILAVPINVFDFDAIGERAAQAFLAGELIEPGLQRRTGVAAVITCRNAGSGRKHAQRHCN